MLSEASQPKAEAAEEFNKTRSHCRISSKFLFSQNTSSQVTLVSLSHLPVSGKLMDFKSK